MDTEYQDRKPGCSLSPSFDTRNLSVDKMLRALHHQASAVVLAHNHPSGTVQPSRADVDLTQTLKTALALIDVRVLDHVIVAPGEALPMAERGLL
jgi:DNA repair protein RadC